MEQSLPAVNHVIAVEPDVKFNNKIIKALQPPDGRTIKVSKTPDGRTVKVSKSTRWKDNQGE